MSNVDPDEIRKFEEMAHEWWDPDGKFKPLHQLNPVRVDYIQKRLTGSTLAGLEILDIGCGGGILSEALGALGANVTGIDRSEKIIGVARAHQLESRSSVKYLVKSVEELARERPGGFDVVLAMEVLEHVPEPPVFLAECATLLKRGGSLFFSTLNHTWRAWLLAIVGAEYVLGWLPKGTHSYDKFLTPSSICEWLRPQGIKVRDISGMAYSPLRRSWSISQDTGVNYLGWGTKERE